MYSKWIKSGFILAMLLVSMVSLSMAGCPWFIKNDLYTAQCGAIKEVPASSGILANDPAGTKVVDPESIEIDPKYGTISVYEDGSFVYDPTGATALRSGTYVIFKYRANNGFCDARYLGIAKIRVSCKCRAEICDDGIDNDCDGLIDGDGEDCRTDECVADNCDNGFVDYCDDSCGPLGTGHCFTTTEGSGVCLANYYCGSGPTCTSSADCGDGVCVTGDCCGFNECRPASDFCSADMARMNAEMSIAPHDGPTGASLGPQEVKP